MMGPSRTKQSIKCIELYIANTESFKYIIAVYIAIGMHLNDLINYKNNHFTILYWTFRRRKCRSCVGAGLLVGADCLAFC